MPHVSNETQPTRVLVVDDSAMVRQILKNGLSKDPDIQVVGTAQDAYSARDRILELRPDVMTLDVEMPRMDGVEFLRRLMPQYPIPVVMVSSLTVKGKRITMEALEAGAVDFVSKPSADVARGLDGMLAQLRIKVKVAAKANVSHWKNKRVPRPAKAISPASLAESTDKVIVIGASTGGTEAIRAILERLPAASPGTVIVQHMPAGFTRVFSDRMNSLSPMSVMEAQHDNRIIQGTVLIAPGGTRHMSIVRSGGIYRVRLEEGDKVSGHCPSVDVIMSSAASAVGKNAIGVMLTGMGRDGAAGMLKMKQAGARTMAQDEKSCIVFGMPNEAYKNGGAEKLVSLTNIPTEIVRMLQQM